MFDFSLGELGIVGLIALLVLGPKDMIIFIKNIRDFFSKIRAYYDQYVKYLNAAIEEVEEEKNIVDFIMDQDGNYQKTYDLSKIMPQIKDSKTSNE